MREATQPVPPSRGLVTSALGVAICNRQPDSATVMHSRPGHPPHLRGR